MQLDLKNSFKTSINNINLIDLVIYEASKTRDLNLIKTLNDIRHNKKEHKYGMRKFGRT